jgi:hypothetical protein
LVLALVAGCGPGANSRRAKRGAHHGGAGPSGSGQYTTRQIERDQFNQPVPTRGSGQASSWIDAGTFSRQARRRGRPGDQGNAGRAHFPGTLVGTDLTDLAVVRIDGAKLPMARPEFGQLAVGDTVVAIGNPL